VRIVIERRVPCCVGGGGAEGESLKIIKEGVTHAAIFIEICAGVCGMVLKI